MRVKVRHRIDRLEADYRSIPVQAGGALAKAVRTNAHDGRDLARTLARESAGTHGKHYYKSITAESHGALSNIATRNPVYEWEYGPDPALPQGGMKFEFGEGRQTKPHLDLARSADVLEASLARDVRRVLSRLRW